MSSMVSSSPLRPLVGAAQPSGAVNSRNARGERGESVMEEAPTFWETSRESSSLIR